MQVGTLLKDDGSDALPDEPLPRNHPRAVAARAAIPLLIRFDDGTAREATARRAAEGLDIVASTGEVWMAASDVYLHRSKETADKHSTRLIREKARAEKGEAAAAGKQRKRRR